MQPPWRNSVLIITNIQCDDQVKGGKVEARKRLRNKAGGRAIQGLTNRRAAEQKLCLNALKGA